MNLEARAEHHGVGLGPRQQKAAFRWLLSSWSWCLPTWPSCSPSLGVRFPESCQDEVRDQKQLLKDAAVFLLSCQIPGLVRDGLEDGDCQKGC